MTLEIDERDLYEIFLFEILKKIEAGKNGEVLNRVQKGVSVEFDFEDFVKERFKRKVFVKRRNGREIGKDIIKVIIRDRQILIEDFQDEVTKRVRLMRGWLWENLTVEKVGDWRKMIGGGQDGE